MLHLTYTRLLLALRFTKILNYERYWMLLCKIRICFLPRSLLPELDLKVYARLIWHWSWLLVLCTLVAAAVAFGISSVTTPIYQASTTLLINQARNPTGTDMQDLMMSERIGRTYAQLMQGDRILAKVAEEFEI